MLSTRMSEIGCRVIILKLSEKRPVEAESRKDKLQFGSERFFKIEYVEPIEAEVLYTEMKGTSAAKSQVARLLKKR